jgi:hypothetical protein
LFARPRGDDRLWLESGSNPLLLELPSVATFASKARELYPKAIRRLQREGKLSPDSEHRTSKYLNNIIEADHGGLKRLIRPTRGFQTMRTASVTIKGFEVMHMIRRRDSILCKRKVTDEIHLINKLFDVAAYLQHR